MPIGYLTAVGLVAVCTLLAVAPVRRPRLLGRMSWLLTLVIDELPFLALYWLIAATALAFAQGSIRAPGGGIGFGVAVVVMVGLLVLVRRGRRAGPTLDRALDEGLGARWRCSIDAPLAAGLRRRLPYARILLAPTFVRRGDVERVADISYGDAGASNLLDVYRHRSRPSGCPVLIHLHGGGFAHGRKNHESLPLIYRFASQGWVCISANYRLGSTARFPDHLIDTKKVIAWTREHGHDYGADPKVVILAGSSAGAHLAASAALTPNDPAFQPGFEHVDTSVAAAVCLYGYYGGLDADDARPTSPGDFVGPDAPAFLVAHGDHDTYVPVEAARAFVARLRSNSHSPVIYAELPGAQHSFDLFHSVRFEAAVDAIEAFCAWVRSPV